MGQIAHDAWIRAWGGGGQPNLCNACILGLSGPVTPPLQVCTKLKYCFSLGRPTTFLVHGDGVTFFYKVEGDVCIAAV